MIGMITGMLKDYALSDMMDNLRPIFYLKRYVFLFLVSNF